MRKLFKLIALLAIIACIAHGAYAQGVRHAVLSACPFVEGESIMIDFDGEVYEYR